MRWLGFSLLCLVLIPSKFSFGQEVDWQKMDRQWTEFRQSEKKQNQDKAKILVPLSLQPVTNKEGVYQQLLDHQVHQAQEYGVPTKKIERVDGQIGSSASGVGRTTYEIQPINSRGTIDWEDYAKMSANYQVFLRRTELQLCPARSHWTLSHVIAPNDVQNRLLMKWQW